MKHNERIRELRENFSFSQQKIANLLHISQRTYSDYEPLLLYHTFLKIASPSFT